MGNDQSETFLHTYMVHVDYNLNDVININKYTEIHAAS